MKVRIDYPMKHTFEVSGKNDRTKELRLELEKQKDKWSAPHEVKDFSVEEYVRLANGDEFWSVAS